MAISARAVLPFVPYSTRFPKLDPRDFVAIGIQPDDCQGPFLLRHRPVCMTGDNRKSHGGCAVQLDFNTCDGVVVGANMHNLDRSGWCDENDRMSDRGTKSLRDALPVLAEERGLSIRAVARAAGVNQSHLSRVLAGKLPASGPLAGSVAEALGLPRDYFPEYRLTAVLEALRADVPLLDRVYDESVAGG